MNKLQHSRKRLDGWINLLTADHLARGKVWYHDARIFAQTVADKYDIDLDRVIGVLACLSVGNRWDVNKRDCEAFCKAHAEGIDLRSIKVGIYPIQKIAAIIVPMLPPV